MIAIIKKHRKGIKYISGVKGAKIVTPEHEEDEIDQLEYDVAGLKEDMKYVKGFQENIDQIQRELADREKDPTLMDVFKAWVRKFLDVPKKGD